MHGYRTSNRFSALYQVLADTGPASFKADYRPATAGRAVPATPRRQSVSCNDTPFDGLRRAGRRSGKGGAVPTSYTHIHRARQRFAMPSRAYPELFAVVGGQVPDLRGLFLRGHGGNSAALGVRQGDAFKAHSHDFLGHGVLYGGVENSYRAVLQWTETRQTEPTGDIETRPVNQAVRYLVRARP